ncbi:MAG: pilus assembly PilX N-terminal domain-containing protein [Minisyncoccia bacterium]
MLKTLNKKIDTLRNQRFLISNKAKEFFLKFKKEDGVTLYLAIVVTSALLLVSFAIADVTLKQAALASINRDSHIAFFAADTGIECALYWDLKNISGGSAFSTSTTAVISCNGDANNPSNQNISIVPAPGVGGQATSTFQINFLPEPYCAVVSVGKSYSGSTLNTVIESKGYNSCDTNNPRRVERAVRVSY